MACIVTSLTEVAKAFKVSPTAISRDWRALGMPGEKGRYDLLEIARWRISYERAKARRVDPMESDVDTGSPALERYRSAQADLAERKLALLDRELVHFETIQGDLELTARIIRGAGDQLKRKFGNDALNILNEAIDDAERIISGMRGSLGKDEDALEG